MVIQELPYNILRPLCAWIPTSLKFWHLCSDFAHLFPQDLTRGGTLNEGEVKRVSKITIYRPNGDKTVAICLCHLPAREEITISPPQTMASKSQLVELIIFNPCILTSVISNTVDQSKRRKLGCNPIHSPLGSSPMNWFYNFIRIGEQGK